MDRDDRRLTRDEERRFLADLKDRSFEEMVEALERCQEIIAELVNEISIKESRIGQLRRRLREYGG